MRHPEPDLPPRIADLRRSRDWSERRLAREIGVDHRTVGRWERGLVAPSPTLRRRLDVLMGTPDPAPLCGDAVRDLRLRLALSQRGMAARLGITQSALSRIEGGDLRPGPELERLLRAEIGPSPVLEALRDADFANCEAGYAAYWRTCAVFDHPDAAAWGAGLARRLAEILPGDARAGRLLARVYASRAYWCLARGRTRDTERMALAALRLGVAHGFDLTSGYALWAWARVRFQKARVTEADRETVRRLRIFAQRHTGAELPYAELVAAAYDRTVGRLDEADVRLQALSEKVFPDDGSGQFGELDASRRWTTVQSYRAMFRLATRHDEDALDLVDSLRSDDPVLRLILGAYREAALVRLGDAADEEALDRLAGGTGYGFALLTVRDHVRRIAGPSR